MTGPERRRAGARWTVRSRILASILVVAAIGMTGAGATAYLVQRERTLAAVDDRLRSHAEVARFLLTGHAASAGSGTATVAPAPGSVTFTNTSSALAQILARVLPSRNESAVGLVDGEAKFIPGTSLDFHLEDDPALLARVVQETAGARVTMGTYVTGNAWYRYVAVPITVVPTSKKATVEHGVYLAAVDLGGELADLNSAFLTYAIVAAAALAAIGLVGWFVAGRLMRPIRQLRQAASRITASERNERIPVLGSDDVSELAATVNDMLDRLDAAMTSQRQLLDDVRHELKTPITIVRGHLEVLDPANEPEVRAARALAIDELDRMSALVDDIESLAETQLARARVRVDVDIITAEVFAKVSVIPDHDWVLVESARATVSIDPRRITQAWLQLADNAAKYSASGSVIEIGSAVGASTVEFWVRDHGPGIAASAVDRIFERFGRVDAGRGIRGSGLGLPIVKAIAMAHGGSVSVTSSRSGSRFGIVVPTLETMDTEQLEGIPA